MGKEVCDKKAAVIFNPYVTGSRQEEVEQQLYTNEVPCEVISTESHLDAFRKVQELNFDDFSALIVVGGDGTLNQVVTSMLSRADKKRLPIGIIPTGTSNDFARSMGLVAGEIQSAISIIAKGECIPVDTTRVVIDHDSED